MLMSDRLHPYQLVFGAAEFEDTVFPAIRQEAEARGVDVDDHERLLLLEGVGELMRSLLPPDAGRPAFGQFSAIVKHAFHFWLAERPTFALSETDLRALLSDGAASAGVPPARAGYVQLPRNLLFARVDEDSHAEAVDGFFFVANDDTLSVLLVLGLLPNRPGFTVIEVAAPAAEFVVAGPARESGRDFENVLPGGEGRLFAVTNALEVGKLVMRVFSRLKADG